MPNLDLFTRVVPKARLHPNLRELIASRRHAPAHTMMLQTMDRMDDRDCDLCGSSRTQAFDERT
jgi:hypothetical protein